MASLEDTPLLDADERQDEPLPTRPRFRARPWQAQTPGTIVLLAATVKFCVVSSGALLLMPIYRLIEDALCHAYYHDDSPAIIDEMRCKVDDVQSRLAFLLGWFGLFNSVLILLVSFPYGLLADRIGRKPTAVMAYAGAAVSFSFGPLMLAKMQAQVRRNPYLLMPGALFLLVGGGVPVLMSTLYAMAADVSSEVEKAASFLYLTFGVTAGGFVGPLLAGLLMERCGPWIPIYIVLVITPLMLCVFFFIPETLVAEPMSRPKTRRPVLADIKEHIAHGMRDLIRSLRMLTNVNVSLILVAFLGQGASSSAYSSILAQYFSKHFGWKLSDVSLLLSPLGLLNLAVLVALPKVSQTLMSSRFRFTVFGKDLFLAQASMVADIVGALFQGFSHNAIVFLMGMFVTTFGTADSPLTRATVSHYVDAEHTSRLYALIAMVEVLGSFFGGPVLAWLFHQGLQRKGVWTGLPWFYVAFLCTISLVALFLVRPPRKHACVAREHGDREIGGSATESHLHPE